MAVAEFSSVTTWDLRGSRRLPRILALLLAAMLAMFAFFAMPTQAHAQGNDPKNWDMPADISRASHTLQWRTDSGAVGSGGVAPGYTFYYEFALRNNGTEPVTVYGFNSNFLFQMHPSLQGDFPLDHCLTQFIEPIDDPTRQVYPQTIAPGQSMTFLDNATYHYIYGPPSNECQQASFYFGPPSFQAIEIAEIAPPEWRDATCDLEASVRIPAVEGVQYTMNGEIAEGGDHAVTTPLSLVVVAEALDGFELADGVAAEWAHEFAAPDCTQTPGGGPTEPDGTHSGGAKLAATGAENTSIAWSLGAAGVGLGGVMLLLVRNSRGLRA